VAVSNAFDPRKFNRDLQAAARRAEAERKRRIAAYNREVDRVDREHQRRVDAYNRKVDQQNKKVVAQYNRHADRVNAHNAAVIADLNRRLRTGSSGPRYTPQEQALADRVQRAVPLRDEREVDAFVSYARIDGAGVADELREHLEALGVSVWFDAVAIAAGKSQALQIDRGLQKARAGVAV
jgi:hypothetical protein